MTADSHAPKTGGSAAEALALAETLIRLPSPNPPWEERAVAAAVAGYLREHGVETQVVPAEPAAVGTEPARVSVFGRVGGRGERPPVIFSGHLDTVPPGEGAWSLDPYAPLIRERRLYGLGAADMKGAVAAMAVVAGRLAAAARDGALLAGDLLLAFTSGEETGSAGAHTLAASGLLNGASALVIGEPTENRVGIAEKGGIWIEIVMRGRTAHGSLPHLGANAVSGLAELLDTLERACGGGSLASPAAKAVREVMRRPAHPLLGEPTLTPTRITGGVAQNVVPDRATAVLDVRTLPGQSGAGVLAAVSNLAQEIARRRELEVEVHNRGERVALDTPADHPLVQACANAVRDVLKREPELYGLTGATDATELVPPLGVPFVICGPGAMAQAHQPDEFVSLGALEDAFSIYLALARTLCGE